MLALSHLQANLKPHNNPRRRRVPFFLVSQLKVGQTSLGHHRARQSHLAHQIVGQTQQACQKVGKTLLLVPHRVLQVQPAIHKVERFLLNHQEVVPIPPPRHRQRDWRSLTPWELTLTSPSTPPMLSIPTG